MWFEGNERGVVPTVIKMNGNDSRGENNPMMSRPDKAMGPCSNPEAPSAEEVEHLAEVAYCKNCGWNIGLHHPSAPEQKKLRWEPPAIGQIKKVGDGPWTITIDTGSNATREMAISPEMFNAIVAFATPKGEDSRIIRGLRVLEDIKAYADGLEAGGAAYLQDLVDELKRELEK